MSAITRTIRLGTRGSALARWQTDYVGSLLRAAWRELPLETKVFTTRGDMLLDVPLPSVGGKGLFTAELEAALHSGEIDLAVHSLKDLPTELPTGLVIGAIPRRADPRDALISRNGYTLDSLPIGATVGTSSKRRAAQLLYRRPDLHMADIRGNVDTRVRKALDPGGPYDAIVLACAGLERLGRLEVTTQILPPEQMLPAPGQGALGVQCRDEAALLSLLQPINDPGTLAAVTAERAFLAGLGGGCTVPIAAYACFNNQGQLELRGRVCAVDGTAQIDVQISGPLSGALGRIDLSAARQLGAELAQTALDQGAAKILREAVS